VTVPASGLNERCAHRLLHSVFVAMLTTSWALWGLSEGLAGDPLNELIEPNEASPYFADFLTHYWPAARQVWEAGSPTPGFQYPPFAAVVMGPLGAVAEGTAAAAWALILGLSAGALAGVPLRGGRITRRLLTVLLIASAPLWHCLRWGQLSLPLTAVAIWGTAAKEWRLGEWLLGGAIAVKGYPAILLAPMLKAPSGRSTVLRIALATAIFGLAVPAIVLGWPRAFEWLAAAVSVLADASGWTGLTSNAQYLPYIVRRLLGGPAWLWAAISAVMGVFILIKAGGELRLGNRDRGLAMAWLTMPLIVPPAWTHYFVFMPWALVVGFDTSSRRQPGWRLLWALAAVLSSVPGIAMVGGWKVYAHVGFPAIADLLLLAAFLKSSQNCADGSHRMAPVTH